MNAIQRAAKRFRESQQEGDEDKRSKSKQWTMPTSQVLVRADHIKTLSCMQCVITEAEVNTFFQLLNTNHIRDFLQRDSCYKISDKYLLAMVFVYFKRANLWPEEFTKMNFFVALFLANDMEEDDDAAKYEILPWTFGDDWRCWYADFLSRRDKLWARMDHRGIVSRQTCNEYMSIVPDHPIWRRNRRTHHAGATRHYQWKEDLSPKILFGPRVSPPLCRLCFSPSVYRRLSSTSSAMSHYSEPFHKNGCSLPIFHAEE